MVGKEKSSAPVRVHVDAMQGGESPQLQEGVVSPQLQGDVVSLQLEEDVVPPQLKDNIVQSDIPATGSPLGDPPQDGVLQGFALVYFENFSSPEIETELVALNQDILPDTDDIDITANEIRRLMGAHPFALCNVAMPSQYFVSGFIGATITCILYGILIGRMSMDANHYVASQAVVVVPWGFKCCVGFISDNFAYSVGGGFTIVHSGTLSFYSPLSVLPYSTRTHSKNIATNSQQTSATSLLQGTYV
jgi:hypothetical protein